MISPNSPRRGAILEKVGNTEVRKKLTGNEHAVRVWGAAFGTVCGRDAASKPTGKYLRRVPEVDHQTQPPLCIRAPKSNYRCNSYLRIFSTRVVRRILSRSAARATTPPQSSSACRIKSFSNPVK